MKYVMGLNKYFYDMRKKGNGKKGKQNNNPRMHYIPPFPENSSNQQAIQRTKKKKGNRYHQQNSRNPYPPYQNCNPGRPKPFSYDDSKSGIFYDAYFPTIVVCVLLVTLFSLSFLSVWVALFIAIIGLVLEFVSFFLIEKWWNKRHSFACLRHKGKHAAIVLGILFVVALLSGLTGWAILKDSYTFWFVFGAMSLLIILYYANQRLVDHRFNYAFRMRPYSIGLVAGVSISFAVSASLVPFEKGSMAYILLAYVLPIVFFGLALVPLILKTIGEKRK